jgi:uncharacterized coiled-coil protein SlyX
MELSDRETQPIGAGTYINALEEKFNAANEEIVQLNDKVATARQTIDLARTKVAQLNSQIKGQS